MKIWLLLWAEDIRLNGFENVYQIFVPLLAVIHNQVACEHKNNCDYYELLFFWEFYELELPVSVVCYKH